MEHSKDSPEVIKFMVLFQKFRDVIDDDPSGMAERMNGDRYRGWSKEQITADEEQITADDKVLNEFGWDLFQAADALGLHETSQRGLFTAPVDPKVIKASRDYQTRYAWMLNYEYGDTLDWSWDEPVDWSWDEPVNEEQQREVRWERSDERADDASQGINGAIDFAYERVMDFEQRFPEASLAVERGVPAWKSLAEETSFDLRGIFRRHALVPFVLIPRHVSRHYGDAEKISLLTNLKQAQEAFIFGVPFAALALMRSILETTLKMHYHPKGPDLNLMNLINRCKNLPGGFRKGELHDIRRLANYILHVENDKVSLPDDLDHPDKFEAKLIRLLNVLRTLIEGAPESRP